MHIARTVSAALAGALCLAPAKADDALIALINTYRAAPPVCAGSPGASAPALQAHPVLATVRIGTGQFLDQVLARAGFPVAQAEVIGVIGAADPQAAMAAIGQRYCRTLQNPELTRIGVLRQADSWRILLARPAEPSLAAQLPGLRDTGERILQAVNLARAAPRRCGEQAMPAAPPVTWNDLLAAAALAHSADMARQRYFKHQGKDGSMATDRAQRAGYAPRRIGENIAVGQETVEDVMAGWLASPGHCAIIMNAEVREMGAAYAIHSDPLLTRVYWTQVFGSPR